MFKVATNIGTGTVDYWLWIMDQKLRANLDNKKWHDFFFWPNCKANTHIFFYVYFNFLPVLHIVNSLKITKTRMYSVVTKMRFKKQNSMLG